MAKDHPAKLPQPATQPTATTEAAVVSTTVVADKDLDGARKEVGSSRRAKNVPSTPKKETTEQLQPSPKQQTKNENKMMKIRKSPKRK